MGNILNYCLALACVCMHKFLLVLLLILTFDKANAAEASDLFEMSLEELLTVKIVTVSKKKSLLKMLPAW